MDIALGFSSSSNTPDISVSNGDLAGDSDLESAVIISLFCNRRADPDDDVPAGSDLQGWWGDSYSAQPGLLIGSKLWILRRAKQTQINANLAQQYCLEALQWLIDQGVAQSVNVTIDNSQMYTLKIGIEIFKPKLPVPYQYNYVWSQIQNG